MSILKIARGRPALAQPAVSRVAPPGVALHCRLELRAQAAGADVQPHRLTVDDERSLLHVRLEGAMCFRGLAFPSPRMLVSDIAAESGTLTADVTSSHLAYIYRPYGRVRMQRKE